MIWEITELDQLSQVLELAAQGRLIGVSGVLLCFNHTDNPQRLSLLLAQAEQLRMAVFLSAGIRYHVKGLDEAKAIAERQAAGLLRVIYLESGAAHSAELLNRSNLIVVMRSREEGQHGNF